ncbi:MAG: nitroreductase family protein [archaeon GB-1845-036]|nr:nitroreductase family protein [Candidatus Culexmicrobium thermophilum]RLE53497.1 MAG: nitroreductase [Candidatus Verstraetearchaeota archaeon]HDO20835.1 nitroreductase [Candidatus Bathyarchaeota archaeon]
MIYEKLMERRTIRKYLEKKIPREILVKCVDAARVSPSAANKQPLKYIIIDDDELLRKVFKTTKWAGYLPEYYPTEREMPQAYIAILLDKRINENSGHDAGIAAMAITMVAYDEGLGSCILGAIDREKLKEILRLPEYLDIVLLVALGYPAEKPVMDEVRNNDIKYWLDEKGILHVPKRSLNEVLRWNGWRD